MPTHMSHLAANIVQRARLLAALDPAVLAASGLDLVALDYQIEDVATALARRGLVPNEGLFVPEEEPDCEVDFDPQTPEEVPPGTPYCFYIDVSGYSDELGGFVPSVVYENVSGHFPLSGKPGGSPWVWGPEYADATRQANEANQRIGVSRERALEIVTSSMRKSGLFGREN